MKNNNLVNSFFYIFKNIYKKILSFLHLLAPKSFINRLFFIIISSIIILQIGFVILIYDNQWRQIRGLLNDSITDDIKYIVNQAKKTNNLELFIENFNSQEKPTAINPEIIKNPEYFTFDKSKLSKSSLILYNKIRLAIKQPIYSTNNKNNINKILVKLDNNTALSFDLTEELFYLSSFNFIVFWLFFSFLIIILIIFQFFRLQIRPLNLLAKEAKKLGSGEKASFVNPSGAKEIKNLIISFNVMKEQIERFVENRTLMLSSISHDLNTILTRISLIIELEESTMINDVENEILLMKNIIASYLDFAKNDNLYLNKKSVNIKSFITKYINDKHNAYNIQIISNNNNRLCNIDNTSMCRVLDNLIINSFKYGSDKMQITIEDNGYNSIIIKFADNGLGIETFEWENVFKPFYKINKARTLSISNNLHNSSSGLGLYTVKDIITKHGGFVFLEKSNLGGITVCIVLPT